MHYLAFFILGVPDRGLLDALNLLDRFSFAQVGECVDLVDLMRIFVLKLLLDVFDAFRGCLRPNNLRSWIAIILERFGPLSKIFEFSLREDVGLQDSRLVVHILQLEWTDGLRLDYFEVNICGLQSIEDVR